MFHYFFKKLFWKVRANYKNFVNFTEKQLRWSLFLTRLQGLGAWHFIKKRLEHRCFNMKFAKIYSNSYSEEYLQTTVKPDNIRNALNIIAIFMKGENLKIYSQNLLLESFKKIEKHLYCNFPTIWIFTGWTSISCNYLLFFNYIKINVLCYMWIRENSKCSNKHQLSN